MALPVQPYRETKAGYCGPAALKMVLAYYGVSQPEEKLAQELGTKPTPGTPPEALVKVAQQYGFEAQAKEHSTFGDIAQYLKQKVPVIVDWFSSGVTEEETSDGHYSVVIDLDDKYIYLQDPELGRARKFAREDFLRVWFDFPGNSIGSPQDIMLRQLIAIYPKKTGSS